MSRLNRSLAAGGLALAVIAPGLARADELPGKVILEVRLRSESVDQEGLAKDAQALTLRTRLGYETPAWHGFKALIEGENVVALKDGYNSTTNGKLGYPVVGDPETTELNRAQIAWTGQTADAVVGRQRLILGNARFVGNAGFRQNEQTFDAARLSYRPTKDLALTYVYIDRVHRVFGQGSAQGEWDSDSNLFQAELKTRAGQLTGYGYLLESDNAPAQSNATWGARFAGAWPLRPDLKLTYEAELARQTDYRNSPTKFDLDYLDLGVGLKRPTQWVTVGFERLEGDGHRGFQTPLATLFAYQGWADVFLTTPRSGVRDLNLRAGATFKLGPKATPVTLQAAAHDFTADDGSQRYGREFDLSASVPITKRLTVEARAASFDGVRPGFADRRKVWLTLETKF
ncbi:hypothetical protein QO010_002212 [Caulobacter ginsengisoli]|uniref:Alginate export domain-containing protein n=1 Tax=Caulobacter ginsengisoli TaxID=400775 RepID=A0ABU0ISS9_9CAUL|nr:hypothetical protein [Caulobacter ginsengisoli]MDQ0464431.1 hypothetical protein [Caulobacter ginsengisoli]